MTNKSYCQRTNEDVLNLFLRIADKINSWNLFGPCKINLSPICGNVDFDAFENILKYSGWSSSLSSIVTSFIWLFWYIYSPLRKNKFTRGSISWSKKVFEGVRSHVMNLFRKCDFGPDFYLGSGSKSQIRIIEKWTKITF